MTSAVFLFLEYLFKFVEVVLGGEVCLAIKLVFGSESFDECLFVLVVSAAFGILLAPGTAVINAFVVFTFELLLPSTLLILRHAEFGPIQRHSGYVF